MDPRLPSADRDAKEKHISTQNHWKNFDNQTLYNAVHDEDFIKHLEACGGLSECPDLEITRRFWEQAATILEVGPWRGRVIEGLIKRGYSGEITAIEHSKYWSDQLQKRYKNIKVLHQDLLQADLPRKFEVILWLWTGIADFGPTEQEKATIKLAHALKPGGTLIVDCFDYTMRHHNKESFQDGQYYEVPVKQGLLRGYFPSRNELLHYANKAGLELIKVLPYVASDVHRTLYLFRRI